MNKEKWVLNTNQNNSFTISKNSQVAIDATQIYSGNTNDIQVNKSWYSEFAEMVRDANNFAITHQANFNWKLGDCDTEYGITVDFDGAYANEDIDLSELGTLNNGYQIKLIGINVDEIELLKVLVSCANGIEPDGKTWNRLMGQY
ncbi:hypothetical protein SH1V18_15140 [Vallitalea longa]|uniref:Uncharacterized protein n=1 Tax=Vallitalea longa TaxID=2936439 RepID=A0A9W5YBR4_9FIRM|nr:hypothetical protein [Vallitalea longa]GKX29034.1 hypothetical protein SH1V18_15140 [Vallitalea longa]